MVNKASKMGVAVLLALAALCAPAGAQVLAQAGEPVLTSQPAYAGMQFYVYRPYNIPKGWFATYDGYPVFKNPRGVWIYGTCVGNSIAPTSYVVGSVVPSAVGIVPWGPTPVVATPLVAAKTVPVKAQVVPVAPISEPVAAPVAVAPVAVAPVQASVAVVAAPVTAVCIPAWTQNPKFMAIGDWSRSVDCIGVLEKPAVPVAWKGKYPKVIYAWTGSSWYQISLAEWEHPIDALRRNLYELTYLSKGKSDWCDQDMGVLAQFAATWGYEWLGQLVLAR